MAGGRCARAAARQSLRAAVVLLRVADIGLPLSAAVMTDRPTEGARMPYLFENLGPERFQQFCQALLVRDFPALQCFPVGQKDGGRDAVSRRVRSGERTSVVAQIKFRRSDEPESADWMIAALTNELPKIEELVRRGAEQYLMVTNARGTAHPDAGRIDRVQAWLDEHIAIPAQCLWRDDLERRLEGASADLKLAYPSVLSGEDALALIMKAQMGPDQDRINRALRAFVAEQFRRDEEVKFRQVELANSLLALFVDVPLDVSELVWKRTQDPAALTAQRALAELVVDEQPDFVISSGQIEFMGGGQSAPTADVLLDSDVQKGFPWLVLQGAPGQGKSTIAQYVCQVQRARFLGREGFIAQVPGRHSSAAFRLPLKVDLRDLASFLEGAPYLGREMSPPGEIRSLEGFLASLISIQSGGLAFTRDDLARTFSAAPVLLFLDGLDEVADLDLRRRLVEAVGQGLHRLRENGADMQVVVTSRPSLFGKSPSFGRNFETVVLSPIGRATITAYTTKWIEARRLEPERGAEISAILEQKLDLSHIRELTKNPMQLTILLSLIQSRGHSLPDVRTQLYSEYVDLFMTREAEKSAVVREYQGLLSEIVEYLAWLLQTAAEAQGAAGSMGEEDLRRTVAEFLQRGQHDPELLEELFRGGIERVWVLVQRIEGLYEFEVQPLREYFAAKFLYSTAPQSFFRNQEVRGDRAQRFEAIAMNPYWANVTRFYAGFYASGEIGALSESLRELVGSADKARSLYARTIGSALLGDWVFKSRKGTQAAVVNLVYDSVGVQLASAPSRHSLTQHVLDKQCGRDVLAQILFERHVAAPEADLSDHGLQVLLRRNGGRSLAPRFLAWVGEVEGLERTARVRATATSGGFAGVAPDVVVDALTADRPSSSDSARRLRSLVTQQADVLAESPPLQRLALAALLEWGGYGATDTTDVGFLAAVLNEGPRAHRLHLDDSRKVGEAADEVLARLSRTRESLRRMLLEIRDNEPDVALISDEMIELIRSEFGDSWATFRLAILTAGRFKVGTVLHDPDGEPTSSLLTLALAGRAHRGTPSWWTGRLEGPEGERLFWLALLLAWAPSAHIRAQIDRISTMIDGLHEEEAIRLGSVLRAARSRRDARGGKAREKVQLASSRSERVALMLYLAIGGPQGEEVPAGPYADIHLEREMARRGARAELLAFPGWAQLKSKDLEGWLVKLHNAHQLGLDGPRLGRISRGSSEMKLKAAKRIIQHAEGVPRSLLTLARSTLMGGYTPRAVVDIAASEEWSFD